MRPLIFLAVLSACSDTTTPEDPNEGELITTVELTFTPATGGTPIVATWSDPEADGSPVIDPLELVNAESYDLTIAFLDELSDPVEDISEEILDEAEEHQVFITGTTVDGPATDHTDTLVTQAYADQDANGLPLGLSHTVVATAIGSGPLVITLQHLPPQGDTPVKVDGLAADIAAGGLTAIAGDTDASVTFTLDVVAP